MLFTALFLSALSSSSATPTQFFPDAVTTLFSDIGKNNPQTVLDIMTEFAHERCRSLTAERDGEITGLSGRLCGLTAKVAALESEKVALRERLSRGYVDFLRASRNLCIRGVLELCEARLSSVRVSRFASRTSVWMEIFRYYPTCFDRITAYDSAITVTGAAQVIAGIFQDASTAIHHYGINGVQLGRRAFSPEGQAILKGIMDFFPIQYTEDEDPRHRTIG